MLWQESGTLLKSCIFVAQKQFVANRSKWVAARLKSRGPLPKPPTEPTVAYIPLPDHLVPHTFGKTNGRIQRLHVDWVMQRDVRRRMTTEFYDPLKTRLNCLRKNNFLPDEIKALADEEIKNLPRDSHRSRTVNRCIITSRPRGVKHPFRLNRMRYRELVDHGKMSGFQYAEWNTSFT